MTDTQLVQQQIHHHQQTHLSQTHHQHLRRNKFYPEGVEELRNPAVHYFHVGIWNTKWCDYNQHCRPEAGEIEGHQVLWLHNARPRDRFVFLVKPVDGGWPSGSLWDWSREKLYGYAPRFAYSGRKNRPGNETKLVKERGVEILEILHDNVTGIDFSPSLVSTRLALEADEVTCRWFPSEKIARQQYGCSLDVPLYQQQHNQHHHQKHSATNNNTATTSPSTTATASATNSLQNSYSNNNMKLPSPSSSFPNNQENSRNDLSSDNNNNNNRSISPVPSPQQQTASSSLTPSTFSTTSTRRNQFFNKNNTSNALSRTPPALSMPSPAATTGGREDVRKNVVVLQKNENVVPSLEKSYGSLVSPSKIGNSSSASFSSPTDPGATFSSLTHLDKLGTSQNFSQQQQHQEEQNNNDDSTNTTEGRSVSAPPTLIPYASSDAASSAASSSSTTPTTTTPKQQVQMKQEQEQEGDDAGGGSSNSPNKKRIQNLTINTNNSSNNNSFGAAANSSTSSHPQTPAFSVYTQQQQQRQNSLGQHHQHHHQEQNFQNQHMMFPPGTPASPTSIRGASTASSISPFSSQQRKHTQTSSSTTTSTTTPTTVVEEKHLLDHTDRIIYNTVVTIFSQDPDFHAILREYVLPGGSPSNEGLGCHDYTVSVAERQRLHVALEAGLPSWAVFCSRYGIFYRRSMRILIQWAINIWPLIALGLGLYDLYSHMPYVHSYLTPLFSLIEDSWVFRISLYVAYFFTYVLYFLQWLVTSVRSALSFAEFIVGPFQLLFSAFSPFFSIFISLFNHVLSIVTLVWNLLFGKVIFGTLSALFAPLMLLFRSAPTTATTATSAMPQFILAMQTFWRTVASPIKNVIKAFYDGIMHLGSIIARHADSLRMWWWKTMRMLFDFLVSAKDFLVKNHWLILKILMIGVVLWFVPDFVGGVFYSSNNNNSTEVSSSSSSSSHEIKEKIMVQENPSTTTAWITTTTENNNNEKKNEKNEATTSTTSTSSSSTSLTADSTTEFWKEVEASINEN